MLGAALVLVLLGQLWNAVGYTRDGTGAVALTRWSRGAMVVFALALLAALPEAGFYALPSCSSLGDGVDSVLQIVVFAGVALAFAFAGFVARRAAEGERVVAGLAGEIAVLAAATGALLLLDADSPC